MKKYTVSFDTVGHIAKPEGGRSQMYSQQIDY